MKILIIGGGPAGRLAAIEAAHIGEEVLLIEKENIGGKCLNHGCMINSALNDVAKFIKDSQKFNELNITSEIYDINFQNLSKGIKDTISKIRRAEEVETKTANVEILKGTAEIINIENKEVIVDSETYEFDKLIMTTGSRAYIPPIKGSENAKTYEDILEFKKVPENLIIVGSGVIAAEYAGIFSAIGSKVHVLCRNHFLGVLEEDIKKYIVKKLLDEVEIHDNLKVNEIKKDGLTTDNGFLHGDVILATGMTPNSELLNDIVDIGDNGEVLVNQRMETSAKDIYAAGDLIGGIGTTPVARMEGVVAARNACGIITEADYRFIPNSLALYYDIAFFSQEDMDLDDEKIITASLPGFAGPGAFWRVLDHNTGFTKVKVDSESGLIRDVSSISPSARTSMTYISKMMRDKYKTYDFDDFMETHPSTDPIYKLMRLFSKFG
jgi:dihydrolipoamide dehydrogenase